jgi:hypothetical protein
MGVMLNNINHELISSGSHFYAEEVIGDPSICCVQLYGTMDGKPFKEIYNCQELLDALRLCSGSSLDVHDLFKTKRLAL